jgi:hypothetical protein
MGWLYAASSIIDPTTEAVLRLPGMERSGVKKNAQLPLKLHLKNIRQYRGKLYGHEKSTRGDLA